jgi:hypothetical protein
MMGLLVGNGTVELMHQTNGLPNHKAIQDGHPRGAGRQT